MGVELKMMASALRCAVAAIAVTDVARLYITRRYSHPTSCVWGVCHPRQALSVERKRTDGKPVPAVA